jgi:hypothetical protein
MSLPGTIEIDGQQYPVAHAFSEDRVIICYDGLHILADRLGSSWWLSGKPATEAEKPVLAKLTEPTNDVSVLTVTKDDE